jgi:integrase
MWAASANLGWQDGNRRRKVVYGRTQAEVRDKLRALQSTIDASLPVPDDQISVGELIERYLRDVAPDRVSPTTLDLYHRVVKHHLIPTLGNKKLAKLTPMEVQALLRAKLDAGYAPRTVRLIRGLLVQCISQAERWGIVARNVARLTDGPKQVRSEGRTLTPLEARRLLDAAHGDRLEACYVVLLALGLRKGEALGLAWSDLDLDRGLLAVRQTMKLVGGAIVFGDLKTSRSRRMINLPDEVVAALRSHRARQAAERLAAGPTWQESGLVFTSSIGTPIFPTAFRHQFDKVCAKAGLVGWHPHELRHSAASIMLAAGVPLEVVSRVLGHASIRITADVYGHMMDPQRQQAADAMSAVLWGSSGG